MEEKNIWGLDNDDLIFIIVENIGELFGKWGSQESVGTGYFKLYDAVKVDVKVMNGPNGPLPVRGYYAVDDGGNFRKDLIIAKDKIVTVNVVVPNSEFHSFYIEVTTGIKRPSPSEEAAINSGKMGSPLRRVK